jgi:hypothetical protein
VIDPAILLAVMRDQRGESEPDGLAGFITVRGEALGGLPLRLGLDATYAAVLTVPTGTANRWQRADGEAVVTDAAADRVPLAEVHAARPELGARLLVTHGRQLLAAIPARAGLRAMLPAVGVAEIEIAVVDYRVDAAAMRGAAGSGSYLTLAWRRLLNTGDYVPPVVPRRLRLMAGSTLNRGRFRIAERLR